MTRGIASITLKHKVALERVDKLNREKAWAAHIK
jgi:hypothetical protein